MVLTSRWNCSSVREPKPHHQPTRCAVGPGPVILEINCSESSSSRAEPTVVGCCLRTVSTRGGGQQQCYLVVQVQFHVSVLAATSTHGSPSCVHTECQGTCPSDRVTEATATACTYCQHSRDNPCACRVQQRDSLQQCTRLRPPSTVRRLSPVPPLQMVHWSAIL